MQPPEPLSNDEIIARLGVILEALDNLKMDIKEIQHDATDDGS